ncbi:hypothetical protein [uncultured Paraglaciecola sp.]|uniref:hypothetical protein n=1 Tax=uncultured Paraglaciecola sp. TaxID=1765024 RepID=UPI0030D6DD55
MIIKPLINYQPIYIMYTHANSKKLTLSECAFGNIKWMEFASSRVILDGSSIYSLCSTFSGLCKQLADRRALVYSLNRKHQALSSNRHLSGTKLSQLMITLSPAKTKL